MESNYRGANFFHLELNPIEKGDKIENAEFASPESVPIHLKWYVFRSTAGAHHVMDKLD